MSSGEHPTSEDLLVVARSQQGLYEYLCEDFANDPDVKVLIDRRRGERRQRGDQWTAERRQTDRRTRPPLDPKLESVGFAIVRTADQPGPTPSSSGSSSRNDPKR